MVPRLTRDLLESKSGPSWPGARDGRAVAALAPAAARLLRWRPDREPWSCTLDQLASPPPDLPEAPRAR